MLAVVLEGLSGLKESMLELPERFSVFMKIFIESGSQAGGRYKEFFLCTGSLECLLLLC